MIFSFLTPSWPSKRKIRILSIFEKSRIAVNYLLFLCQICSRDNLDRKLQAQELARIMDERFACLHPFSLLLFFLFYSLFIPKCLNVHAFAAQTLWCFWDMWRHLLKVATTACWLRRDEQRLEGTVSGVLFNVVHDLYRETLMTGVCLAVLNSSYLWDSNWIVKRDQQLCPGLNASIALLVLRIWKDYLTFSYYFTFDRIVRVLVTFYPRGHFVMLIIRNLNLISVQS